MRIRNIATVIKIFFVSMLLIFLEVGLIKIYIADMFFEASEKALSTGDVELALHRVNKAINYNPLEPNYYRERAKVLLSSIVYLDMSDKYATKQAALEDMEISLRINPKNLVTKRNLVPLYYFLAVDDYDVSMSLENIDSEFLPQAKSFFSELKAEYPNDVGVLLLVAKYEKKLLMLDEYEQSIRQVKDLRPDLLDWYVQD